MLLALVVAVSSVGLGAAVGAASVGGTGRVVGPIQVFALSAAIAVAAAHLLPEAYADAGAGTLVVFALGLGLPAAADYLGKRLRGASGGEHGGMGLEMGYAGLLLHKVGDGFALGAATGPLLSVAHPAGVALAVGGHTVPLTALVVLAFHAERGLGHALWRAAGLAVAMAAGAMASAAVPAPWVAPWQPWILAAVAGLLVHVVAHGWRPVRPRSAGGWLAHALAALAGLAIVFVGRH
ncbi:MAG: hypothetical protein ACOC97_02730 [Myxococcota bacterium]